MIKRHFYGITSPFRVLPDFIIIGTMRSGTTSLNFDLAQHPCITPAAYDEIGFFDSNFELGLHWYRSLFPSILTKHWIKFHKKYFLTGEDTPFYFWNPLAAERIKKLLPDVKLIALLRNPIDRAYSNYHTAVRIGAEKASFEEQIQKELALQNEDNKENFARFIRQPSYLAKSIYADQLEIWFKLFNHSQILIITTEDLEKNPTKTLNQVFQFLNLPSYEIKKPEHRKAANYEKMNANTRKLLIDYFKPHNERLYAMIGKRFDWDK
ncbi:MAG: sulfotransferase [Candidatus Nanoarchaeia archaeon]